MCADVGSALFGSFREAAESMVRIHRDYEPSPAAAERYHRYFSNVYVKLYDAVKALNGALTVVEKKEDRWPKS